MDLVLLLLALSPLAFSNQIGWSEAATSADRSNSITR
jgi:hypothetical protein